MSKWKVVLLVLLVLVTAIVIYILSSTPRPVEPHPFFVQHDMLVIAHRGGRGLWPENTLYGFSRAHKLGVDILEMDIRATADGALVALHDDDVERTTNGRGSVEDLTLERVRELDAGYTWTEDDGATFPFRGQGIQIPTVEEIFSSIDGARFVMEIKPPSAEVANALCRIIRDHRMESNVLVPSFHQEAMDEFRESCPTVATGATPREALIFYQLNRFRLDFLQRPRAEALQIPPNLGRTDVLTPRFLSATRKFNIEVHVWTINDVDEMRKLVGRGVGGIMTDYPDRLLAVLGRQVGPAVPGEEDTVLEQ
jgi:glycerophosphoryl diester phosphodiesterase